MITSAKNGRDPTTWPAEAAIDSPHSSSVMRQTQATIGVAVLGGVAASYFADPAWLAIPTVIGIGLLVAGATGVCPMAMAIACLPWNRATYGPRSQAAGGCCGGRCE